MKGLVFGPPKTNVDLSASGKRLRVESSYVGRPGGVFVKRKDDKVGMEMAK